MSQDSTGSAVTRLHASWLRYHSFIPDRSKRFVSSTQHPEQLSGVQWLGHEAGHSSLSTVKVKNVWSYVFIVCCLIMCRGNFILILWCGLLISPSISLFLVYKEGDYWRYCFRIAESVLTFVLQKRILLYMQHLETLLFSEPQHTQLSI